MDLGGYTNDVLKPYLQKFHPTGSNYICDPPVTDTDIDWVVLVHTPWKLYGDLEDLGWEQCGSKSEESEFSYEGAATTHERPFSAYRRGNINLIFVFAEDQFDKWVAATEEAKKLNLLDKADRVACFQKYWAKTEDEIKAEAEEKAKREAARKKHQEQLAKLYGVSDFSYFADTSMIKYYPLFNQTNTYVVEPQVFNKAAKEYNEAEWKQREVHTPAPKKQVSNFIRAFMEKLDF